MKTNAYEKHNENVENLLCIGVDGRTDKDTLHYKESVEENGSKILKKAKGPECHLTITKETPNESIYLTHRVLPDTGATGNVLAEQVADVLKKFKSLSTIKAVLVDNTNTKTGCKGGFVTLLEKKIFTLLVAPYNKMNFHLKLYSNILMAPQKSPLHSMVHWLP